MADNERSKFGNDLSKATQFDLGLKSMHVRHDKTEDKILN